MSKGWLHTIFIVGAILGESPIKFFSQYLAISDYQNILIYIVRSAGIGK